MIHSKSFKLIALSLLLGASSLACNAKNVVVWDQNGESVAYDLAESPVITYSGTTLLLKTDKVSVEYQLANVHKLTFDDATGIGKVEMDKSGASIKVTADGVFLSGFAAGMPVAVYSEGGQQILRRRTAADGSLAISLANWKSGVYVVKADHAALKIVR